MTHNSSDPSGRDVTMLTFHSVIRYERCPQPQYLEKETSPNTVIYMQLTGSVNFLALLSPVRFNKAAMWPDPSGFLLTRIQILWASAGLPTCIPAGPPHVPAWQSSVLDISKSPCLPHAVLSIRGPFFPYKCGRLSICLSVCLSNLCSFKAKMKYHLSLIPPLTTFLPPSRR